MVREVTEEAALAVRPASVLWYERIAIAALIATAPSAWADRATLVKYTNQSPILYPISVLGVFVIQAAWIWLIARRRKNWARWISIIFSIGSIPAVFLDFDAHLRYNPTMAVISLVAVVISVIAVSMLLRRDARDWFSTKPSSL
ncbi:hypothetical protein ACQR1I_30290 [Bradyrhizobium sp. HKCCYLS2038]